MHDEREWKTKEAGNSQSTSRIGGVLSYRAHPVRTIALAGSVGEGWSEASNLTG